MFYVTIAVSSMWKSVMIACQICVLLNIVNTADTTPRQLDDLPAEYTSLLTKFMPKLLFKEMVI
jgi:hypothetical protein